MVLECPGCHRVISLRRKYRYSPPSVYERHRVRASGDYDLCPYSHTHVDRVTLTETPLRTLGSIVSSHRSDVASFSIELARQYIQRQMSGVPQALLEECFLHVELRMHDLARRSNTHQTRSTLNWLGRWAQRIQLELSEREQRKTFHREIMRKVDAL